MLQSAAARFGRIRVGQKHRRGVPGDRSTTCPGFVNIDVTSGSGNKVGGVKAKTLSPLTLGPVLDADGTVIAQTLEGLWQGGKMWPSAGHIQPDGQPTPKWHAFRTKEYQRLKGKRRPLPLRQYGRPTSCFYQGRVMKWVESRKQIYVPAYAALLATLPVMDELEKLVKSGQSVMLIDGDGPPKAQHPQGVEMTPEAWSAAIEDTTCSFGHGYVVARELARRCFPDVVFP